MSGSLPFFDVGQISQGQICKRNICVPQRQRNKKLSLKRFLSKVGVCPTFKGN